MNSKLRVAIVHNWAWKMRGAERCLEAICEMYPQAEIYMLFGDKERLSKTLQKHTIKFSWLNKLPNIKNLYKWTLPLWPSTVENWSFHDYDLVISSSAAVAKGVITSQTTAHLCYMYTPLRYVWDMRKDYFAGGRGIIGKLKRFLIEPVLHWLRIWDVYTITRPDRLIVISNLVKERAERYLDRKVDGMVSPPADISKAISSSRRDDYFVAISPFEENKGLDLLLESAKELGFILKIIGTDNKISKYINRYLGFDNIHFLGWVTEIEKYNLLSRAKGALFLGKEEFGIAAVEALACSTPVVIHKNSGAREFVYPGTNGVLLEEETINGVRKALDSLRRINAGDREIADSVLSFTKKSFKTELQKEIDKMLLSFNVD